MIAAAGPDDTHAVVSTRPLRIGIDGRALQPPMGGIGRYVHGLLAELPRWLPNVHFVAYVGKPMELDLPGDPARWTVRVDHHCPWFIPQVVWLKLRCAQFLRHDRLDLFWGCSQYLPELGDDLPNILTVYDLVHRVAPLTMSWQGLAARLAFFSRDVLRAGVITSISQGTAARLHASLGRSSDLIVPPGVDPSFRPRTLAETAPVLARHGISGPYFLALATAEPRKNLPALIEAVRSLASAGRLGGHTLILCGRKGWKCRDLEVRIAACGPAVRHLGYVPAEDLPSLVSGATALVFPTIYEGFGMPAQEAAACGTWVLAPDLPELREAGGGALRPITVDPAGIARGLVEVMGVKDGPPLDSLEDPTGGYVADMARMLLRLASPGIGVSADGGQATSPEQPQDSGLVVTLH